MKCNVIPYEGTEPFIFFSYCHADETRVYPIIEYLSSKGCRIWYDNGIAVGSDWPETIAKKLTECKVFVAAVSQAYCDSHNCKNELTFEVEDKKDIIAVVMEDFSLPLGVRLQLSITQQLRIGNLTLSEWTKAILENEIIHPCIGAPISVVPNAEESDGVNQGTDASSSLNSAEESNKSDAEMLPSIPPVSRIVSEDTSICSGKDEPIPQISQIALAVSLSNGEIKRLNLDSNFSQEFSGLKLSVSDNQLGLMNQTQSDVQVNYEYVAHGKTRWTNRDLILSTSTGETYWIFTGKVAEQFDAECCFYLVAKETGEVKIVHNGGLPLGRVHKWVSGVMSDKRIGRNHGEIIINDGQAVLVDHSKNGSYVNGSLIHTLDKVSGLPVSSQHVLNNGDTIRLGNEEFDFRVIQLKDTEEENRAVYRSALSLLESAENEDDFLFAAKQFGTILPFLDAQNLYERCLEKARDCHNAIICESAAALGKSLETEDVENAIAMLMPIKDWHDVAHQISKLEEHLKKCQLIQKSYEQACTTLKEAVTEDACSKAETIFKALKNYRDSEEMVYACQNKRSKIQKALQDEKNRIYDQAVSAFQTSKYDDALKLFEEITGWKDADLLAESARRMKTYVCSQKPIENIDEIGSNEEPTYWDDGEDAPTVRELTPNSVEMFDIRPLVIDLATGNAFNGNLDSTIVGRKQAQCDITFPANERLSRKHFEIFIYKGKHHIRDCNSSNGTVVNGQKLQSGEVISFDAPTRVQAAGLNLAVVSGKDAGYLRKHGYLGYLQSESDREMVILGRFPMELKAPDPDATVIAGKYNLSVCGLIQLSGRGAIITSKIDGTISVKNRILSENTEAFIQNGDSIQVGTEVYRFRTVQLCSKS